MFQLKNSSGEAGKSTWMGVAALGGRESYLVFYKMVALSLLLNLVLLGAQWVTAIIVLPKARAFFIEAAIAIVVFLVVFAVWLKPSIEYHWEVAQELSEKNELRQSLRVVLYRVAVDGYWQIFAGHSLIWSFLALTSGLLSVASGCVVICLLILAPGNDLTDLVRTAWTTAAWSAMVQLSYCLLAHNMLTIEREDEDVLEEK